MSIGAGRLGVAAGVVLGVAGCANASYLSAAYVGVAPQIVTTACRDAYEVYDKREEHKLLVVSHLLRELAPCDSSGATPPGGQPRKLPRFEQTARVYFAEIRRAECRIVSAAALSPLHYEINYACEGPGGPPYAVPRRGRG